MELKKKQEKKITSIKGVRDIYGSDVNIWNKVEDVCKKITSSNGFNQIILPTLEYSNLYKKSIGDATDIVDKEMYTFMDKGDDFLTLRPEGTAGCVRAIIQHNMTYNGIQRLWYLGSMFRRERPQRARYREFKHFGIEVFGVKHPSIDAQITQICFNIWKQLNISSNVDLQINSIGNLESRKKYIEVVKEFFKDHYNDLDDESKQRLEKNPLRLLDSKISKIKDLTKNIPKIYDYLTTESQEYFDKYINLLKSIGINYTINPRLVRGLDYYNDVVFEWVAKDLGSQSTICAGGRYDTLVNNLGGNSCPAIGCAIGLDRVIEVMKINNPQCFSTDKLCYIINNGDKATITALQISDKLRKNIPGVKFILNNDNDSFKKQFKKADKLNADIAIILGDDEISSNNVGIKDLKSTTKQEIVDLNNLIGHIKNKFKL